jgi:hypothetical protein
MKMTASWEIELCIVQVDQRSRGAYCLHHQGDDNGGSTHIRNVGLFLRHYTAPFQEGCHVLVLLRLACLSLSSTVAHSDSFCQLA